MTLYISDQAEEFRLEISGSFTSSAVADAAIAWKAALLVNTPRRICIDITRMTSYDHAGYLLLREAHAHGTHIAAGTPRSLQFFEEISTPQRLAARTIYGSDGQNHRGKANNLLIMQPRATASGE